MSEGEGGGGDYELAKAVEAGTQEVLIPAIRDMGQTLEKVSSSVGTGAERVADTALEADATAAQGLHDAEQGLNGTPSEGGVNPNEGTNTSGGGTNTPGRGNSGTTQDNFNGGNQGGQGSGGTGSCATGGTDPVDVVSGQMITAKTDVELPGVLPLVLRRAYASGYEHGSLFGPGWSSTLDQRLVLDADGIHFLGDDAQILNYGVPTQPGQQVLPVAGARWPLNWDRRLDAIEILDPATGITRHFAPAPRKTATTPGRRQVRHLTRVTDRNGNWLTITRDEDGVPTEIDHIGGYRVAVDSTYRGDGFRIDGLRLLDETRPEGTPLIGYAYDPAGRLVEILDPNSAALIYEYDDAQRITAWIDQAGYRYDYTYDPTGRVIRTGGEDGALAAILDYDLDARCTKVTNGMGAVSEYWYDEHNHVAKVVDPLGNSMQMRHDRHGRLLEVTDALGQTTSFTRDAFGNAVEVRRPDGSVARVEYNGFQLPAKIVTPGGAISAFDYDERGNLVAATDPTGAVLRYGYTENGGPATIADPSGNVTSVTANRAGLPLAITNPLGATWSITRDTAGRITRLTDPFGNPTTTKFDATGRRRERIYADGSREAWTYDARGHVATHTNQVGAQVAFEYGPFSVLIARIDADGSRYEFTHDSELRLTKVTNPLGSPWTYEYDAAGSLVAEQDFNGRRLTYAHDAARRLVQRTNGAEETVELIRDALGRVIEQRAADGTVLAGFSYNADSALVHAVNDDTQLDLVRDPVGRVLSETINGNTLTNVFDALGNRTSRISPSGRVSTWQFDATSRPLALTTDGRQITFGHDLAGRESHRWISDDTALTNEWDSLGRLSARRVLSVTGPESARTSTVLSERTWTYRPDGHPDTITDLMEGARRYDLDVLGRVTAVRAEGWSEHYAYDTAGNLTSSEDTRTPDSATSGAREVDGTLLRRAGHASYEYDAQGRLTRVVRRTLSGGQNVSEYGYDAHDRLTRVRTPDAGEWRYVYDPLGRRVAKRRLGSDGDIVEEIRFSWDGPVLAEQVHRHADQDEITATTWDYEPGSWTPVTQDRRIFLSHAPQDVIDRQFRAIVADLVGTPIELLAEDGSTTWRHEANLWGAIRSGEATGEACPLGFPGQYRDAETGLNYNYQRYYDPQSARYITPDPLGLIPAPHHHGYVRNPLVLMDPLGLAGTRTFFSVQDPTDTVRLLENGGNPWPTGHDVGGLRDIFGPGLYTWESQGQAEAYMAAKQARGATDLNILQHTIPEDELSQLSKADLSTMGDDAANDFLERGGNGGAQWVRRVTGRFGPENYFSPDTYSKFTNATLDCP